MAKKFFKIIFLANLFMIFWLWWLGSSHLLFDADVYKIFIALGRVFGLLGEYLILIQLVLVGRVQPVEKLYGFDNLNAIHRRLGKFLAVFLLFHPILLTIGYAHINNVSLVHQFSDFLTNWEDVFKAFLGLVLLLTVVGISLSIVRKKLRYETWYFSHLLIYVAIGLFFNHQINTADISSGPALYYWLAINFTVFGLMILYRFVRPLYLFWKHRFHVEKTIEETPIVQSVYIVGRKINEFKFEPGQYANITLLDKNMWYTHPFSFSQAPNGQNIRFSIKSSGDYTSHIKDIKAGTKVIIDGPLGIFTPKQAKRDKFLFIAGGIGITPIRAMIESLSKKDKDIILLCGNRSSRDAVFENELKEFSHRHHMILSEAYNPSFEHGHINEEKITRLAPDFKEREIYVCGPVKMMESVIKILKHLGASPAQIHYEKFSF